MHFPARSMNHAWWQGELAGFGSLPDSQLLFICWDLEGVNIKVTGDTIFCSVNIHPPHNTVRRQITQTKFPGYLKSCLPQKYLSCQRSHRNLLTYMLPVDNSS